MRTLKFFILLGIIGVSLSSFISNKSKNIELTSPLGFQIANSYSDLLTKLNDYEIEKVTKIEFVENDKFNAAFIDVELKNGETSRRIIGKGEIINNYNLVSSTSVTGTITYSCSGCSNCIVGGTIDGNGVLTVTCSKSCCTLNINTPPISGNP